MKMRFASGLKGIIGILALSAVPGCGKGLNPEESDGSAPDLENASTLTALNSIPVAKKQFLNRGSPVMSCTVTPTLPPGLNLEADCSISGVPTITSPLYIYVVTGSNPAGSSSAMLPLIVNDGPPDLEAASLLNGFTNQAMAPFDFTNGGGPITSCGISPALPSGLSISLVSGTCRISGTPTSASPTTQYTVTGASSSGQSAAPVWVKVSNDLPCLDDASVTNLNINVLDFSLQIGNLCGGLTACAVAPALPAGLSIAEVGGVCVITGIPSALAPLQIYTITGTNPTGSDTADLPLAVLNIAPVLANAAPLVAPILSAIAPMIFANSGGDVTSCSVTPALPAGLSVGISGSTCRIAGTPSVVSASTLYTVTGTNAIGSSSATASILTGNIAPALSTAGALVTNILSAIAPISFPNAGGAATSCSSSPTLPTGLSVGVVAGTCQVSGTPTLVSAITPYLITGSNDQGSSSALVTLTTNEIAPVIANVANTSLPILGAITPILFPNTGGNATSCSVAPALPLGLGVSLSNGTCMISGLTSIVSALTAYTVTATNPAGSDTATVSLLTLNIAPNLANASAVSTRAIFGSVAISFVNSGGDVLTCSVAPALPLGLVLAPLLGTCRITGVPLATSAATTYTVTGANLQGSDTATVSITITN